MKKSAGILMPLFSLPSDYGIGAIDKEAYSFIDFLEKAGQSYWQMLPVGQTGFGDSPYQSFSSYAGNPYFISLEELLERGFLKKEELDDVKCENSDSIDYSSLYKTRYSLLGKAFSRFNTGNKMFLEFKEKNGKWLDNYSLFMALKSHFGGKAWFRWDEDIKKREEKAVKNYKELLKEDIDFYDFVQFMFYSQWGKLKEYANDKGIKIIGDMPIYVAMDSVDTWAHPHLFQFDEDLKPIAVAGCPPDGFSKKGQLWGNPLYDFKRHREDDYKWWTERICHYFDMFDGVRIDHFRGFDEYYAVPFGNEDATEGKWEKGPGKELFNGVFEKLEKKELIAEDLGFMTDSVKKLLADCGFPGMKVLEFAFDVRDGGDKNDHLPHNYTENCVAYTGTHDNQTLKSWFKTISKEEQKFVREYLCDFETPDHKLNMSFIGLIMRSCARLSIIPVQDYLELDDKARINTPGTNNGNWNFRLKKNMLTEELAEEIRKMTKMFGR